MKGDTKKALLDLLWLYLKTDPYHWNCVSTGWGPKTQEGLVASIEEIMKEK